MSESLEQPFSEQFESLTNAGVLPGGQLPWLSALRRTGIERFQALGFPSQKVESWKYTSLRPLERTVFHPATDYTAGVSLDTVPSLLQEQAGHRAVFVNGRFRADLSRLGRLPDGAEVLGLQQVLETDPDFVARHMGQIADGHQDQAFYHLNSAFTRDGLVLRMRQGARVEEPIEVVTISAAGEEPLAYHPRNLIVLDAESEATLVEYHVGLSAGTALSNVVTEFDVGRAAKLHHYKLQGESESAFHMHTLHGRVQADGFYDGFGLTIGGKLSRNELHVRLEGSGADARLNGGYLQHGKQQCDNTTLIEHTVPDTWCREIFKGALAGKSRGVFQGKLHVHPDAQRTDGNQLSRCLLLSDECEIDAKPELEIYADDVVCSHGSTAGSLDAQALFYMRSRGIPYAAARRLLVESFLAEGVAEMTSEALREAFMVPVRNWLDNVQA